MPPSPSTGLAFAFGMLARRMARKARSMETARAKRSRSGSEKRRRGHRLNLRFDDDEWALLKTRADERGLSRSAYMREQGLGAPGVRTRRKKVYAVEAETMKLMSSAIGAINRADNNANQIARELNRQKFLPDGGIVTRALRGQDNGAILAVEAMCDLLQPAIAEMLEAARVIRFAVGATWRGRGSEQSRIRRCGRCGNVAKNSQARFCTNCGFALPEPQPAIDKSASG